MLALLASGTGAARAQGQRQEEDCPIPRERLFASFAQLRNPTDAAIFGLTCLDPLLAASGGLAPLLAQFRDDAFDPLQAGLLVTWAEAHAAPIAPVLARLRISLDRPRRVEGYWLDARGELRAGPRANDAVVATRPAPTPDAGPPRPRALSFELFGQTASHAEVGLGEERGWVDKRQLLLPAITSVPAAGAPTFVRIPGELTVLRADPARFVLGFPEASPAAVLAITIDRKGRVLQIARAKPAPTTEAPRTCVPVQERIGYAFVAGGLKRGGRFWGYGVPAECR
jgi:hypothetical protein